MTRRRIALVGLGMAVTPHAKSLVDLKDKAEVVWAMSRSDKRRADFAAKFPFPVTGDIEAIIADSGISAVGLLTPPNTHLELVSRLVKSGKHVLLEKPLDITTARSEALVAAGEAAGVKIAVCLQHRFKPAAERLAALLAAQELGKIVSCSTRIPLWRPQTYYDEPGRGAKARDGGGVLITQGIHTLDLMLSLAGPVEEVCGFAMTSAVHRMETEDLACAAIRYKNGAIGIIEATTAAYPGGAERIDFIGTKGTASLAGTALTVAYNDGRREELAPDASAGGTGADPMAFPHDYHLGVWRDFLDAIDTNREPRVSAREALKVHRLVDAVLAAADSDKKVKVAGGA
ncbi:MAG: Gfo/Idh/MocA family oxidoreductase [Alphaproteobacteria bacterium]|nr:Gfo/Idh/MocA family oxidoreductase [Alphaproteobacteria bacterium]MDE2162755.1 Gfo/Idh/MocA family oxidoreductase [Alphaproteobacteria bacterium]MDE2498690.1 Gfo/Idh/MocA family oxidoreductase [Alphaproteobacteria bacterium]